MTCERFQELIVDSYYKECSVSEALELDEHLSDCEECSTHARDLHLFLGYLSCDETPLVKDEAIEEAARSITGPVSAFDRFRWSFYEALSPAGYLLLPGFVSAVLCSLTLGPVMYSEVSIKLSSGLLLLCAVMWTGVYTTLVSAIFNSSSSTGREQVNLRLLVYSVLAGCFLMNATLYLSLKGILFSPYLTRAVSVHLPRALSLCSAFAILVVATAVSIFEERYNVATTLSIVPLYLAINIPVFFCVSGSGLTMMSIIRFVSVVVAAGIGGTLAGGIVQDILSGFRKRPIHCQTVSESIVR